MLRPTPLRSAVRLPPASPALLPVGAGGYFSSAEFLHTSVQIQDIRLPAGFAKALLLEVRSMVIVCTSFELSSLHAKG